MTGISKGLCLGVANTAAVYAALAFGTDLHHTWFHKPMLEYGIPVGLVIGALFGLAADRLTTARPWLLGVAALLVSFFVIIGISITVPKHYRDGFLGDLGTQLFAPVSLPTVIAALVLSRWTRPVPASPVPHAIAR
jgi:hypothetical protein